MFSSRAVGLKCGWLRREPWFFETFRLDYGACYIEVLPRCRVVTWNTPATRDHGLWLVLEI